MYHLNFWLIVIKSSISFALYPQSHLYTVFSKYIKLASISLLYFSHPQDTWPSHYIIPSALSSSHQIIIYISDLKISLFLLYEHHLNFWRVKLCPLHQTPLLIQTHLHFWLKYCPLHSTLFTPLTFLSWVLHYSHNLHFWLEYCLLHSTPSSQLTLYLIWVLPSASNPYSHHFHFWLGYCPLHPRPLYTTYISDLSIALYIQPLFTTLTFLTRVLPSVSGILGMRMGRTSSLNALRSVYSSTIVRRAFPEIHLADRALSCKREMKNAIRCKIWHFSKPQIFLLMINFPYIASTGIFSIIFLAPNPPTCKK